MTDEEKDWVGAKVITKLEVAGWSPVLRCGTLWWYSPCLFSGEGCTGKHQRDKLRERIWFQITS